MSRIIVNKKKTKVNLVLKFYLLIFSCIIIIFFFWLFNNIFKLNILSNYIESLSKKYDYVFSEVEINGLNNVSEVEINQYFDKYYNKSIFTIPIKNISQKIEKNNWIESVILKNNFKNKISIYIKELKPIAAYFNGKNYLLISQTGYVIDFTNDKEIQEYFIIEGDESIKQVSKLITAIPSELKSIIIKAQFINNRRWDIYTKENLRIKLPEVGYNKAMNIFSDIYNDLYSSDIKDIEYIDLRISGKAIIKFYNENS